MKVPTMNKCLHMIKLGALFAGLSILAAPAWSDENRVVVDALSGYMDFAEYSSSMI